VLLQVLEAMHNRTEPPVERMENRMPFDGKTSTKTIYVACS
jgi:hypothetical protein